MYIVLSTPSKSDQFAMLFQHTKAFTDHINLTFFPDHMYIQCMDTAHVSIMETTLPAVWFDKYTHTEGDSITIGLSSSLLYKILNAREKTQVVELVYDADNASDRLNVHLLNDDASAKTDFEKRFEIPLMEIDNDTMEIPAIEHQAEITISAYHFASIINQLKMFGDTMEIQCSEEKIMLVSNSPESGKMFVEMKIDDLSSFIIDEGGDLSLAFSLSYLHNICLYHKIAKEVELKFSTNYPMCVSYYLDTALPESTAKRAQISFYLAPKINDD